MPPEMIVVMRSTAMPSSITVRMGPSAGMAPPSTRASTAAPTPSPTMMAPVSMVVGRRVVSICFRVSLTRSIAEVSAPTQRLKRSW